MTDWIRLEPEHERDGSRYAWKLVIDLDNDWQDWKIEGTSGGGVRFSLHVDDEMAAQIPSIPRVEETKP